LRASSQALQCGGDQVALAGESVITGQLCEALGDPQLRQMEAVHMGGHPTPARFGGSICHQWDFPDGDAGSPSATIIIKT